MIWGKWLKILSIPRLVDLCYQHPEYEDEYAKFATDFVQIHSRDWLVAQDHWETVVGWMLNSKEIPVRASMRQAMNQAVIAAATFLLDPSLNNQCPVCAQ